MRQLAFEVTTQEFDLWMNHLQHYKPQHGNMHLRHAPKVKGVPNFRHLHILKAVDDNRIEGIVSGPNIEIHYQMVRGSGGRVRFDIFEIDGAEDEIAAFGSQFNADITKRVYAELSYADDIYPRYKKGQFYVKRSPSGSWITSRGCQEALSRNVLSENFLEHLRPWNFLIVNPQEKK